MSNRLVIAGMGEVGSTLAAGARACGWEVREVRRAQSITEAVAEGRGPVLLAMREDDLEAPLREAIACAADDVIVLQNGFIDELIDGASITRCVLWLTKKGEFRCNARPTLLHGKWAGAMAEWLSAEGVPAVIESDAVVRREGLEKAAWSCLVGNGTYAYGRSFAELVAQDEATARAIVYEACDVAGRVLEREARREGAWAMVEQTREPLGWMKGSAKGLDYRAMKVVRWAEDVLSDGLAAVANGAVVRRILAR